MNKFLKKGKAASILGVSSRTIFRYLKKGLLVPAYCGNTIGVWEEDVIKLKKIREQDVPTALDRELVMRLLTEVETIKSQMSTVLRILNIKFDPLNLTPPEYRSLYEMTEIYSNEGWPPQAEQQWADIFVRLRIDDLEEMKEVSGDEHPWRGLLRLATTMQLNAYDNNLQNQLTSGKANVHNVAGTWCILKGESAANFALITRRDAAPNRRLVRRLGKTRTGPEPTLDTLPLGEGSFPAK